MVDPYGYDELPYPSAPYPYTHPDHLATLATLFGLETADVADSRVLEVGCADGSNLIPMALTLPGSHFVGIDLSERQIATGRRLIDQLELTNIELRQADLNAFTTCKPFDWIIAHGFYSWTSREARSQFFHVCRQHLTPHGVAFVSYNVLPGWQPRLALRQWLLEMTRQIPQTTDRLRRVRGLFRNLSQVVSRGADDPQLSHIRSELGVLEGWSDAYLRHDLLEDFNEPVSFVDFVAQAREYGLKFLAEADFATMVGKDLPVDIASRLPELASTQVLREQLIDILTNRPFRQSLLCHQEQSPREHIGPDVVRSLYAISTLKEVARASTPETESVVFGCRSGFQVAVEHPVCCEALRELERCWPAGEFVGALMTSARDRHQRSGGCPCEGDIGLDVDELATILLAGFADRSVELHVLKPPFEPKPSAQPEASRLARAQAAFQPWVSSLRHDLVPLSNNQRLLVRHLDGTRCRTDLFALLDHSSGSTNSEPTDEAVDASWIDAQLRWLARRGLLSA